VHGIWGFGDGLALQLDVHFSRLSKLSIFVLSSLVVVAVCYALLCLRPFQAAIGVLLQLQIVGGCWLWRDRNKSFRLSEGTQFFCSLLVVVAVFPTTTSRGAF
jgi:hypothetical protein